MIAILIRIKSEAVKALAWVGHAFAEDFGEETSGSWEVELQDLGVRGILRFRF